MNMNTDSPFYRHILSLLDLILCLHFKIFMFYHANGMVSTSFFIIIFVILCWLNCCHKWYSKDIAEIKRDIQSPTFRMLTVEYMNEDGWSKTERISVCVIWMLETSEWDPHSVPYDWFWWISQRKKWVQ